MAKETKGFVNSVQTLGTLDGPGVRYVVFMQGCPLRCACCHNPETQSASGGKTCTAKELFEKAVRFREYFGNDGGVTLSGGEPLIQARFAAEFFELCKSENISTCLDTSGAVLNDGVRRLLKSTDYCLLDIKYSNNGDYEKYVGCKIDAPLEFLKLLDEYGVPTRIRQVIIGGINDSADSVLKLKDLVRHYRCVEEIELLPFKNLCRTKYEKLGMDFRFQDIENTSREKIEKLQKILED